MLRPLRADDFEALRRAFLRLAPEEIEHRFCYRSRELPASPQAQCVGSIPCATSCSDESSVLCARFEA